MNGDSKWDTVTLKYEAPLSSYLATTAENTPTTRPAGTDENFTFAGWYTSPSCDAGTEATKITTMPIGGLVVYAKWAAPTNDAQVYFDIILEHGSIYITVPYGE